MWKLSERLRNGLLSAAFAGVVISPADEALAVTHEQPDEVGAVAQLQPVHGDARCDDEATDCNHCVANVPEAFARIASAPAAKLRYRAHGGDVLPPFQERLAGFGSHRAHVQGIARSGDWLALTRSSPGVVGGAGLFLVDLAERETRFYFPIADVDHPGGLSALGRYAFVAADCDDERRCGRATFIDIFDLASPGSRRARVQRVRLGAQGEPGRMRTITSVAVTRLQTGPVLMFVQGKDSLHEGWFYESDGAPLQADTAWTYRGYWARPLGKRDEYQNTSLVTECGSGEVYLIGTGNGELDAMSVILGDALGRAAGVDTMSLLKLSQSANGTLGMDRLASRSFDPGGDGFCTFRAAANVHATRTRDLMLYCSTRKAAADPLGLRESTLKLAVFTP
ncbi:MAG TPA: hypothetical protein VFX59_30785 [Polyangiales bacterium]|nr:hypothetical protein [Polyangiales bacterium]